MRVGLIWSIPLADLQGSPAGGWSAGEGSLLPGGSHFFSCFSRFFPGQQEALHLKGAPTEGLGGSGATSSRGSEGHVGLEVGEMQESLELQTGGWAS